VVKLGREVLGDLAEVSRREWILSDGLGGYASSTAVGLNTRRYHGLLVAATRPPDGRMVLLSKLEETLQIGETRYELATNAYPGAVHPRGFEAAESFTLDPLPLLVWQVGGARLARAVAQVHGRPATVVVFSYEGTQPAWLELRPLLAYRGHHALQHENDAVRPDAERRGEDLVFEPYAGCPLLYLRMPGATWEPAPDWYRNFEYERERERGLDFREDLFGPGRLRRRLAPGETVVVLASIEALPPAQDLTALVSEERRRQRELADGTGMLGDLRRASDLFLVRRGEAGRTVIAGYHWFCDWGRDTMISLPGLCLATGRFEEARAILTEWARHVDGGMIPNRFPDTRGPEYNTVDAALWMVVAAARYLEASGDREFVRVKLGRAITAVLDGYEAGTRHGIHLTREGLVTEGEPGVQLTWMDAKVGDRVITPRRGEAVEIQALWYNALLFGADLARDEASRRAEQWNLMAARTREAFLRWFWSEELGYLADVVSAGTRDLSLRPNQLYAVGLPHSLLPREKAVRVLEAVKRTLLTPVGLRTLAPADPAYRGRYEGGPAERDEAYHQGTAWPFLMGIYFDALIRVHGESGKEEARKWLDRFAPRLSEAGLGVVGEIYDGDPPHRSGGAIAQAWSVAELLRSAIRLDTKAAAHAARR
jgi:predicted glycogen debranching enzyme